MSLAPERPPARAIYAALIAGATGEKGALTPSDIPPEGTVAKWVGEIRREARDAVNGIPGKDSVQKIADTLGRKLRDRAAKARTPSEIAACAKAAREVAQLHRELSRPAPQLPGRKPGGSVPAPDAPPPTHTPEDPETTWLREQTDTTSDTTGAAS